jgi:hypothetical protein
LRRNPPTTGIEQVTSTTEEEVADAWHQKYAPAMRMEVREYQLPAPPVTNLCKENLSFVANIDYDDGKTVKSLIWL